MRSRRSLAKSIAVLAAIPALSLAMFTEAASATPTNGVCDPDGVYPPDLCVYYSTGISGAIYDHWNSINYQDRYFIGSGSGVGQHVRNNAASAWFRAPSGTSAGYVYYSPNQQGTRITVPAGSWVNLGTLRNNNASQKT